MKNLSEIELFAKVFSLRSLRLCEKKGFSQRRRGRRECQPRLIKSLSIEGSSRKGEGNSPGERYTLAEICAIVIPKNDLADTGETLSGLNLGGTSPNHPLILVTQVAA
jgi:hypothetical protein